MRGKNYLPFANIWVHPGFFVESVLLVFLVFCVVLLYILSSMLWCPLRFPHKTMFVYVLCMVASNSYCGVCFVLFVFVLCMVVSNSYCGVLPVLFVLVLCMMVSNSYCGVFFVLFCLRLVFGGIQQLLWCVFCFVFVLCMVVSNSYCGVFCFVFVLCMVVSRLYRYISN